MSEACPSPENRFYAEHAELLLRSYSALTGRDLLEATQAEAIDRAKALYEAPFFVASHDRSADPLLTYGNRVAQELFEMDWDEFTGQPSRFTAEPPNREERQRLLDEVRARGFIDDYSGIRISKTGKRFLIRRATVWNLVGEDGQPRGQAATFAHWTPL